MVRLLLTLPLLVVLIVFALSNREAVTLSFLGYALALPLSVAVLLASAVFFVLGALLVWFGELRQRRRARRAEHRVVELERQLAAVRRQAEATTALGPATLTPTPLA